MIVETWSREFFVLAEQSARRMDRSGRRLRCTRPVMALHVRP